MEKTFEKVEIFTGRPFKDSGQHIVIEQCKPQCDDCTAFQPFRSLFFAMEDGL